MIKAARIFHVALQIVGFVALCWLALVNINDRGQMAGYVLLAAVGVMTVVSFATAIRRYGQMGASRRFFMGLTDGRKRTFRLEQSTSYTQDTETVWALIRPAESAALLSPVDRASSIPGTPIGVGEQQCFIRAEGKASILEVIAEQSGRSARTKTICPSGDPTQGTYDLQPEGTGCRLIYGVEVEGAVDFPRQYKDCWIAEAGQYLTAIAEVLNERELRGGSARPETRESSAG